MYGGGGGCGARSRADLVARAIIDSRPRSQELSRRFDDKHSEDEEEG